MMKQKLIAVLCMITFFQIGFAAENNPFVEQIPSEQLGAYIGRSVVYKDGLKYKNGILGEPIPGNYFHQIYTEVDNSKRSGNPVADYKIYRRLSEGSMRRAKK